MAIKNYTTEVPAHRSIQEIQDALVKHGANEIRLEYEQGTGRIASLKFVLLLENKYIPFQLPVDWRAYQKCIRAMKNRRANTSDDQCYRVAWRVIRDWVIIQMTLVETQMVNLPQIFLPYAQHTDGRLHYQVIAQNIKLLLE